jgi:hypothetical protein
VDQDRERAEVVPGSVKPRRFRPRWHYELIGCGLHGHELLGTDVAEVRAVDNLLVRELGDGLRWCRCVRCDSWVPLEPPTHPARTHLPARADIQLPLRGRPLRDRYVLRLIAVNRFVHFLVLGALSTAVLLFAVDRASLSHTFYKILDAVQGTVGVESSRFH